jgi:hypothetical protein
MIFWGVMARILSNKTPQFWKQNKKSNTKLIIICEKQKYCLILERKTRILCQLSTTTYRNCVTSTHSTN